MDNYFVTFELQNTFQIEDRISTEYRSFCDENEQDFDTNLLYKIIS